MSKLEKILTKYKPVNNSSKNILYFIKKENKIKYLESKLKGAISLDIIEQNYNISISDNSVDNPFLINSELIKIIHEHTKDKKDDFSKARAIFDWVEQNIEYGTRKLINGYRNSKEVLLLKEGICGEMAYLYITMARSLGLKSNYVSVSVDNRGKKVSHGCASVRMNRHILVDPAYHTFDIKHSRYRIISDREAIQNYKSWRYNA